MKIFGFLILLFTTTNVIADNNQNKGLRELLDLMKMDSMVDGMYSQMEIMMQNIATEMGVQPSEQVLFDEYFSRMVLVMREEMSWEKMEPKIIDIYTSNFTEKEISDMLDFYKTETGQSAIEKLPIVTQQSMEMSQEFARIAIPKIQAITREFEAELIKHRENGITNNSSATP